MSIRPETSNTSTNPNLSAIPNHSSHYYHHYHPALALVNNSEPTQNSNVHVNLNQIPALRLSFISSSQTTGHLEVLVVDGDGCVVEDQTMISWPGFAVFRGDLPKNATGRYLHEIVIPAIAATMLRVEESLEDKPKILRFFYSLLKSLVSWTVGVPLYHLPNLVKKMDKTHQEEMTRLERLSFIRRYFFREPLQGLRTTASFFSWPLRKTWQALRWTLSKALGTHYTPPYTLPREYFDNPDKMSRTIGGLLYGMEAARIEKSMARHFDNWTANAINPAVLQRVNAAKRRGALVILATATLSPMAAKMAEALGLPQKNVIASTYEVDHTTGRLTGKMDHNHGKRKAQRVKEEVFSVLQQAGLDFSVSVITDSASDAPLMNLAGTYHHQDNSQYEFHSKPAQQYAAKDNRYAREVLAQGGQVIRRQPVSGGLIKRILHSLFVGWWIRWFKKETIEIVSLNQNQDLITIPPHPPVNLLGGAKNLLSKSIQTGVAYTAAAALAKAGNVYLGANPVTAVEALQQGVAAGVGAALGAGIAYAISGSPQKDDEQQALLPSLIETGTPYLGMLWGVYTLSEKVPALTWMQAAWNAGMNLVASPTPLITAFISILVLNQMSRIGRGVTKVFSRKNQDQPKTSIPNNESPLKKTGRWTWGTLKETVSATVRITAHKLVHFLSLFH